MSDLFAPEGGWRVRILDLSGGAHDNIVEEVGGFETLMQANAFARRYVRDSVERCRGPGMTTKDVLEAWFAFGEDAARIDGATRLQTMFRIFLPLCTPGFISAGIFAFTLAQNEFLYALIFLTKTDVRTVPVGAIAELVRGDVFYWGQLMAAALLGSIPVAIIYSFFVEHYVAGLTSGGVKA